MMRDLLPDLCDAHPGKFQLLHGPLHNYGGRSIFYGPVVTVKCFEDNSRVKELLQTPGDGHVLVVDGGGSHGRALMGDLIARSAVENGWAGVVINGVVRDVGEIALMDLGVKALGSCPVKTERRGQGEVNVPLNIFGITIMPGDYLYADLNGVIISRQQLTLP